MNMQMVSYYNEVASIDVNGTTVTITGDDIEMEDVFSYVKIDASDDLANATIDPSACGDGVTYEDFRMSRRTVSIKQPTSVEVSKRQ